MEKKIIFIISMILLFLLGYVIGMNIEKQDTGSFSAYALDMLSKVLMFGSLGAVIGSFFGKYLTYILSSFCLIVGLIIGYFEEKKKEEQMLALDKYLSDRVGKYGGLSSSDGMQYASASLKEDFNNYSSNQREKWIAYLKQEKAVGGPLNETSCETWAETYPNSYFALLPLKKQITDFDSDGTKDQFIFFEAIPGNCGNELDSDFGLLLLSNSGDYKSDFNIVQKIENRIKSALFVQTSQNYHVNISFNTSSSRIIGTFQGWVDDDSHCCPSLEARFIYDAKSNQIQILN